MGTKMVSLRLDEELLEWATGFAAERGVSRTSVVELALRSLREDARGGVARSVGPAPAKVERKLARLAQPPVQQRPPRSKQSELAMARMRRMDPGRYGGGS
jgi:hypothetical protein